MGGGRGAWGCKCTGELSGQEGRGHAGRVHMGW